MERAEKRKGPEQTVEKDMVDCRLSEVNFIVGPFGCASVGNWGKKKRKKNRKANSAKSQNLMKKH